MPNLTISIDCNLLEETEDGSSPWSIHPRIFVDGQQLGLVTDFEMHLSSQTTLPEITVRFPDLDPADVKRLQPSLVQSLARSTEAVRKFPFIQVESPFVQPVEERLVGKPIWERLLDEDPFGDP